jgi:hypothetical protein
MRDVGKFEPNSLKPLLINSWKLAFEDMPRYEVPEKKRYSFSLFETILPTVEFISII